MSRNAVAERALGAGRKWILVGLALAAAVGIGACSGSYGGASAQPSVALPTFPPDDLASGTGFCIDEPTTAILDQLRDQDADVPALLVANKAALIAGLSDLQSNDANTIAWRDAFVSALQADDMVAAAQQVTRLANDEVTITPC